MSGSSSAVRRVTSERGVTLIEVALMLTVAIAMIGALMPVATATVRHAETTRATTDMNNLATVMPTALTEMNFTRFTINGARNGTAVNLLVSDGDMPRECTAASGCAGVQPANWNTLVDNAGGLTDFLERHLVTNNPRGNVANAYPTGGGNPWRGAYLTAPINPDPWGNRYMVNSQYFGPNANDVVVLSAGPNEIIETVFAANPLAAGGDDLIVLVEP